MQMKNLSQNKEWIHVKKRNTINNYVEKCTDNRYADIILQKYNYLKNKVILRH